MCGDDFVERIEDLAFCHFERARNGHDAVGQRDYGQGARAEVSQNQGSGEPAADPAWRARRL